MRQRLSASDSFHRLVDDLVRRAGGPGHLGQLLLRLEGEVQVEALAEAWRRLGDEAGLIGARTVTGLRGAFWRSPRRVALELGRETGSCDEIAPGDLRRAAGEGRLLRLTLARDGVVLTWHHRLCDARGAQGMLVALTGLAAGRQLGERWWKTGYRADADLPASSAARGQASRRAIDLLRPMRLRPLLRPSQGRANRSLPFVAVHRCLGVEGTAACDARLRAAVGRFGETPFLLACTAAALEDCCGIGGDLIFPLAVDTRVPGETRLLTNAHGFMLLPLPGGLASRDLTAAAKALRDSHRRWVAEEGIQNLLSALSWFPWCGGTFARYQLGFGRAGLAASCLVANTGRSPLEGSWFGATIRGVDHLTTVPGQPGVAVLFHRDGRGLGCDVIVTGALLRRLPPQRLAERLVHHLVERPLEPLAGTP